MDLPDPSDARDWLALGLSSCRVQGLETRLGHAVLQSANAELGLLPPPGFLLDLAALLRRANLQWRVAEGPIDRAYDDLVVGRLATDPLRMSVADALAALPDRLWAPGVVVLAERLLARVGQLEGFRVEPGAIRDLDRTPENQWLARADRARNGPLATALQDATSRLAIAFRATGRLLRRSDVHVLERLEHLERRSDRLALTQIVSAAELLSHRLPRRRRATRRREGLVRTELLDESAYPVGGFTSLSNKGSPENLVTSELALMEDGEEIDLFDVRFAEGELLYYTRDETTLLRERRAVLLSLDASLDGLRFRDEGVPYQRLVMALGWTVALVRTLIVWLAAQDLRVVIDVPRHVLDQERNMLELALQDAVRSGILSLETVLDIALWCAEAGRRAPVDLIVLHAQAPPSPLGPPVLVTQLACGAPPTLRSPFSPDPRISPAGSGGWEETLQRALADLV